MVWSDRDASNSHSLADTYMKRRHWSYTGRGEWVPGPGDSRLRGLVKIKLGCWGTEREPEFQECSEPGNVNRREIQGPD